MTTQAKRDQSYMRPTSQGEQVDNFLSLEGSTLGDYQLEHKLGTGGMAVVYLARQISLRRKVALKILKPHLAETGQYVERFQNEAQSAASLNHANIVQIHEVGMRDNYHFIAQEYVAGPNLKQLIESQAEVSYDLIVSILQQTVSALCKAEEEGIVHRDIKPENILITSRGEIKVADFGLARIAENNNKELTQV
ncbi:MAG: protein kinase, partial [Pirellulaceae bacterium]|nr:protein kinase [Pirellulaceae bacterium]